MLCHYFTVCLFRLWRCAELVLSILQSNLYFRGAKVPLTFPFVVPMILKVSFFAEHILLSELQSFCCFVVLIALLLWSRMCNYLTKLYGWNYTYFACWWFQKASRVALQNEINSFYEHSIIMCIPVWDFAGCIHSLYKTTLWRSVSYTSKDYKIA